MPYCPKCSAKLTKRKSTRSYHCKSHGFVRNLMSPPETGMTDAEFFELKEQGAFDHIKKVPITSKPKHKKHKLNLKGVLFDD